MNAITAGLVERAADDEATLRLTGLPEIPFGQHAQATMEKLLKALINEHGAKYPRTHDLGELVRKLGTLGETLPLVGVALDDLTGYATDFRYDGSSKLPPPLDRESWLDSVERIRAHILARIEALNSRQPSPPHNP